MKFETIRYEKNKQIAHITINRPAQLNSLTMLAHRELRQAFEDFRDDPDMRVAILTGAGDKSFCAGQDLKELEQDGADNTLPWGGITSDFECWKPIIAAVNGFALGGGTELSLACDIVVASETASFGLPEPHWGIIAGAGGVHRLVRQVPLKLAMGLILTGKRIEAAEAYRIGLVNEVVPPGELQATATRWAEEIIRSAPLSVEGSKRAALTFLSASVDEALAQRDEMMAPVLKSEDKIEGLRAFAEKRPAVWKGV